jgi:hypothetical protein
MVNSDAEPKSVASLDVLEFIFPPGKIGTATPPFLFVW